MKTLPILFLVAALAGCAGTESDENANSVDASCSPKEYQFYLSAAHGFTLLPEDRLLEGNGFVEAFLTNDMDEFTDTMERVLEEAGEAAPSSATQWTLEGNFSYQLTVQTDAAVAPIASTSDPREGYHFFNQFGTTQGFTPGYDVFYEDTVSLGERYVYHGGWALPDGGVQLEPGDELRFLLTNLVLPSAFGTNPHIDLDDSWIQFTASCQPFEPRGEPVVATHAVSLPLNQGLLTGAVPANDANQFRLPVSYDAASKLQFTLTAPDEVPKDDVDMTFYDAEGNEVWSGGSPYTNEIATLWAPNLEALGLDGFIEVVVNGYSSVAYEGELQVLVWSP